MTDKVLGFERRKERPRFNKYGLTQWYWIARHHENLKLGKNVQIGAFTLLDCMKEMEIQDNVKIGWSCTIISYSSIDKKSGKITLKKGCKVGANSVIFPGVTIGEEAIVGANSLIRRDVPAGQTWVGSPAIRIK